MYDSTIFTTSLLSLTHFFSISFFLFHTIHLFSSLLFSFLIFPSLPFLIFSPFFSSLLFPSSFRLLSSLPRFVYSLLFFQVLLTLSNPNLISHLSSTLRSLPFLIPPLTLICEPPCSLRAAIKAGTNVLCPAA